MKKSWLILVLSACAPAYAGPFTDDMGKCLVRTATPDDKVLLVQWMFSTMTIHPDVKHMGQVSDAQRAQLNKKMGDLMVALLSERCPKESREAVKNEGMQAVESSFNLLGQVAAQALFTNPDVAAGLSEFAKGIDESKLKKLFDAEK
jgi:hypothetical protein